MKRLIRKPTREELPAIRQIEARGGVDVYRDDWPAYQPLADAGLIALSPPRGMGKAWKRAVIAGKENW